MEKKDNTRTKEKMKKGQKRQFCEGKKDRRQKRKKKKDFEKKDDEKRD